MIVTGPVLVLAVLVIVPLGLRLLTPSVVSDPRMSVVALGAGVLASVSLVLPAGPLGAALTVPWLAFAALLAVLALRHALRQRSLDALARLGACGGLAMGAGWLALDRAGATGAFGEEITRLTAVHFHYAGFAGALIAGLVWGTVREHLPRTGVVMLFAVLGGPWLTALGFTVHPMFQAIGAVIVATGLVLAALLTLAHAVPAARAAGHGGSAVLLAVSSLSVLVPMGLAVQWALAVNFDTPALSLHAMALTHGLLNALGFALAGLLGWLSFPRASVRDRQRTS